MALEGVCLDLRVLVVGLKHMPTRCPPYSVLSPVSRIKRLSRYSIVLSAQARRAHSKESARSITSSLHSERFRPLRAPIRRSPVEMTVFPKYMLEVT